MSALSDMVQELIAAGASVEVVGIVVRGFEATRDGLEDRRANDRDRKRRQRDKSREGHVTVAGQSADDPLSLAPSPQTPQPHTQTRESISTGARPSPKSNGFARFWEAYPRKIAKGAAEAAYAKALRRIEGPDPPGVLLLALERVKPTWRDPQFIPHPATWLNQTRWEDTPETVIPLDDLRTARQPACQPSAKLLARHANYRASLAGAEIATRVRAER